MPTLKLISRSNAMDHYVDAEKLAAFEVCEAAGVNYGDPRDSWDDLRNYEIEAMLVNQSLSRGDKEVWIITEWCPFEGIFCKYMNVASIKDLKDSYKKHLSLDYLAKFILDDLEAAVSLRGDLPEDDYYPEGADKLLRSSQLED